MGDRLVPDCSKLKSAALGINLPCLSRCVDQGGGLSFLSGPKFSLTFKSLKIVSLPLCLITERCSCTSSEANDS